MVANGEAPIAWSDLPAVRDDAEPTGVGGVWDRASLPAGFVIEGPAVVIETNSAVLLEEPDSLVVLDDGTLQITT